PYTLPDFRGIEALVHFTKSQLCCSTDCILSVVCISASPIHSCEHIRVPPTATDCFIQPRCITRLQDDPSLANGFAGQSDAFGEHDMFAEKDCVLLKFSHPNNSLFKGLRSLQASFIGPLQVVSVDKMPKAVL